MIPDPLGLNEWYRDAQMSKLNREKPLGFVGFLPVLGKKYAEPATYSTGAKNVNPCKPYLAQEHSNAEIKQPCLADPSNSVTSTFPYLSKEVPFHVFRNLSLRLLKLLNLLNFFLMILISIS